MRVTTGTVVDGRIEVAGETFPEGLTVTILAPDEAETFGLGPQEEGALLAAMAEADRGEVISAEEFLQGLGRRDQAAGSGSTRPPSGPRSRRDRR